MVLSHSSDDDGPVVSPPPSTKTPPLAVPASVEMRGRRRTHEATAAVPKSARATPALTAKTATAVLETTQVTPVVAAKAASQRDTKMPSSSAVGQGGSRRARWFIFVWREC